MVHDLETVNGSEIFVFVHSVCYFGFSLGDQMGFGVGVKRVAEKNLK